MPYPRHEAELERRAIRDCLHAFRHPSELPSQLKSSWRQTRDYYAARDVVDLEREELIELISWTRKIALKMAGSALFLGILLALALIQAFRS
ncbi:hypothetical protein F4776DRAFT_602839 [Hypoxylon sp. NC0597]|nr:hypothetical protein F4776DRAFT_602839 [Hypoxylon sp. NC0597]